MAFLAFQVCTALGGKKKGGRALKLEDFLPKRKEKRKGKVSVEAMLQFVELATWAWGGKDLRKKDGRRQDDTR